METMLRSTIKLDDQALTQAVTRFKALADRTRLGILALMVARRDAICVCEVNEFFDLEQPTISHHLKVLRDAGLVVSERRANWAYYHLHPAAEGWVRSTLAGLRD
jgi:ArsR family transcriptional regulator, arsenate/arsenite/antimonite-responsive transcriptional repressor